MSIWTAEVCAKEVLDQIFEVGGLMPKASEGFLRKDGSKKCHFQAESKPS